MLGVHSYREKLMQFVVIGMIYANVVAIMCNSRSY